MKSLSDITAPMPVKRKLLEKDVQKKCVDWARARGWWARKFSSQSQRSVPDYLFATELRRGLRNYVLKLAVEFKAPGKASTEAQRDEQIAMMTAGWYVAEIDNFEDFKKLIEDYEGECS